MHGKAISVFQLKHLGNLPYNKDIFYACIAEFIRGPDGHPVFSFFQSHKIIEKDNMACLIQDRRAIYCQ